MKTNNMQAVKCAFKRVQLYMHYTYMKHLTDNGKENIFSYI